MSVVIDASVLAAWFLDEKRDPRVEAAFDMAARVEIALAIDELEASEALTPSLFFFEVRNALVINEKRVGSLGMDRPIFCAA